MSITLTNAEQWLIGGVSQENNNAAANMRYTVDFSNPNTVTFEFQTGVVSGATVIPGQHSTSTHLTVDMATGKWVSSNGLTGTVPAGPLANFVAQFKAIRNSVESYAVAQNIILGTAVAWP
jgi:hypothetical protein